MKFFLENKTLFLRSPNMNLEKGATPATSATPWVKLLICNTIVCSRYEVSTCYTLLVPATPYITPPKATHLSTARKSITPRKSMSVSLIVNRGLRSKDFLRLRAVLDSFIVWYIRTLSHASWVSKVREISRSSL